MALERLVLWIVAAAALAADAVVEMRFATSMLTRGASEILAYGTAVRLAPETDGSP